MFTKEELRNLLVFLSRTNMAGSEVPVYVNLTNKIAKEIEMPEPTALTEVK